MGQSLLNSGAPSEVQESQEMGLNMGGIAKREIEPGWRGPRRGAIVTGSLCLEACDGFSLWLQGLPEAPTPGALMWC